MVAPRSPAEEKAFAAEKRIAIVRAAVIVFNVAAYYGLLPPGTGIPWLAATISVAALAYAAFVLLLQPYRWWPIMQAALFTALTDGALIVLWVAATGSIHSPFHLLWLLSMMAVAFRYDSKATMIATGLYVSSYIALLALEGQLVPYAVEATIRCTYIALAGLLGALMAHDSAVVFEAQAAAGRAIVERQREQEARELDRLRELDRFKTDFINAAAHELNTPLTPLRLQVHLLNRPGRADDPDARGRSVRIITRNVERLGLLVADMLDVARLQSGRLNITRSRTDVAALAHDAIETYEGPAQAKQVRFRVDSPPSLIVEVDGKRVSQILYNLVSNAVKYAPPGSEVTVRLQELGGLVRFEVQDQGVGFSPEQRKRMFLPFSQVHVGNDAQPGTGLGLFISKNIAERHGGTLDASSPGPGHGALFTCILPSKGPEADLGGPQGSSPPAG